MSSGSKKLLRRASVFHWSTAIFLSTFLTKCLATNNRTLMLLDFLSAALRTTCIRLEIFFLNCVKTFQESSLRLSSTTSKIVLVLLTTSMSRNGIGNPSFGTELNSWFNVMTTDTIPSDRPENHFGLHPHPSACLVVETRSDSA